MAEIAVSFVVEKMGDMLIHKAMFLEGVHDQVERLKTELKRMQCFLKDADARQQEDERVRYWVSEIRELAYQADDAIDLYITNVVKSARTGFLPWRSLKKLANCNKIGKQIEKIEIKIQDISRSLVTYGINSIGERPAGQMLRKLRYTSPLVNENIVVGLKEESDKLVKQLVGGDQRRWVISVVGMGGIGKTTLAKNVYNDRRVTHHFQSYRAWVYVSQDCRPREIFRHILRRILPGAETRKMEKLEENELGEFLHELLRGKRFLVVLDDIWKSDDWKFLAKAFPEEEKGSRLLLTTRNREVAKQADPRSSPHDMQTLSDGDSWKLFCRTAIPESDADACPPELEDFGQKMVKKCGGLPLAIVVLGGLLSSKTRSPTVWETVLNNLQGHFASENGVDAILSLSYIDLPHNLKPCFLYLGLFPEDQVIPKRRLLLLWIAEGFVPQQHEQLLESIAEDYLNELINRNLVQAAKLSVNERVTKCRIHDLVRDLCIKKAKELNFSEIAKDKVHIFSSSIKSRRLGVYDINGYDASTEPSTPYIRSLLFFKVHSMWVWSNVNFSDKHFKLLRVLDLGDVELRTTSPLGKLIHLRYLRFNLDGHVKIYPSSFPNCLGKYSSSSLDYLYLPTSLQTLTLETRILASNAYLALESVIQKLVNLRHLSLYYCREDYRPLRIERLKYLQTLSWIWWSDWLKNETGELTSLQKLKIKVSGWVHDGGKFTNSIAKCQNLRSLYLEASPFLGRIPLCFMNTWLQLCKLQMIGCIQQLPEAHCFPPNLMQLTLESTKLPHYSMEILERLPKLLTLRLRGEAFEREPRVSDGGFPQLRNLQFLNCYFRLNIDKGGMPKLAWLQISGLFSNIYGLGELLHLRKVDFINLLEPDPDLVSYLPSPSEWHEIKRHGNLLILKCHFFDY